MAVANGCKGCYCNECLKNNGIYGCPGCTNCIGVEDKCENKVTMDEFLNELHLYLERIYNHFTENHDPDHQWWKLLEEAGELIADLGRTKMDFNDERVLTEAADYVIVAMQLTKDCARSDISNTSTKQLYNNLTMPIMMHLRGQKADKLLIDKSLRFVIESIYQEIERSDLMDRFNMIIFSKVTRTIDRIEMKYYENLNGGIENERI